MDESQPTRPTKPAAIESVLAGKLTRGTSVDRYVVLDVLGRGGMGVVYTAFDPELERKVAIKLLAVKDAAPPRVTAPLPGVLSAGQSRLLREAQALARLAHPNVVAVYDVGTFHDDRVFVAMELIAGRTLRDWLGEARSWRAVLPVVRAAGVGLAAAHAAGLVHRDFKPENVMVGDDGRVRVMDFGLASDAGVSGEGAIAGTPGYIAPEIHASRDADARADQFAFGVVLYEAMFRERPFSGSEPPRAPPRPPDSTHVPARIERVALRALAIDPAARYPSMDALLADLVDPARARRRALIAAGAIALAGGAVVGGLALRRDADLRCTGFEPRLAGVWDRSLAATARQAFLATNKPFAARTFAGLERALDGYAAQWTAAAGDSCRATRIRGEQTEEVMTLRQQCFDRRLEELRALTHLVASAHGNLVDKGDKAVFELEAIATCANVAALRAPEQPPPEKRPQIDVLERQIVTAKAQLIAEDYLAALLGASNIGEAAKAIGWDPIVAEALFMRGSVLMAAQKYSEAQRALADATWAGLRSGRDDFAAAAALTAALASGVGLGRPDEATFWLDLGTASAHRVGLDRSLEQRRQEIAGIVLTERGDINAGVVAHEKALALAELVYGKESPAVWFEEQLLGTTYTKAGAFGKALPHYERARRMREGSVGREHPDIAVLLSNIGTCHRHLRDFAKARGFLERSLALRERFYGSESFMLVAPLVNLADLTRAEGDVAKALAIYDRAQRIAAAVPGTAHVNYHHVATDRAETLVAAGRFADARAAFAEVLALEETHHSAYLPETQSARAELALAERAWTDAATWATRAIAELESRGGPDSPTLWLPLTRLAEAKLGAGDRAAARPLLERALAIATRAEVTSYDLDRTRAGLAKL